MHEIAYSAYPTTLPLESISALLWVGNHDYLIEKVVTFLQYHLCTNHGCNTCNNCHALRQQQHHAVTWLYPDKYYTLEQLKVITATLAFSLEAHQHHFFIVQKADCLTTVCSNSLLKSLEEPPAGYHFILLTERPDQLLPTIQSRCIRQLWHSEHIDVENNKLFAHFANPISTNPLDFFKDLETAKLHEQESIELLDSLLAHWLRISKHELMANNISAYQQAQKISTLFTHYQCKAPMPGSSNLFWKELYLQFSHLI